MDFVVAGLGFGALVVVLGFAVRDIGPLVWRPSGYLAPADSAAEKRRWVGRCQAIGAYSGLAGGAVILATLAAVALGVSDGLGAVVVAVAAVLSLVLAGLAFARRLGQAAEEGRVPGVPVMTVSTLTSSSPGEFGSVRRVPRPVPDQQPAGAETTGKAPPRSLLPDLPDSAAARAEEIQQAMPDPAGDGEVSGVEAAPRPAVPREGARAPATESDAGPAPLAPPLEPSSQPTAPSPDLQPTPGPVEQPPAGALFKSPLLADIRPDAAPVELTGGFSSSILAGVDPNDEPGPALSPLLQMASPDSPPAESEQRADPAAGTGRETRALEPASAASVDAEGAPEPLLEGGEDTLIDSRPAAPR